MRAQHGCAHLLLGALRGGALQQLDDEEHLAGVPIGLRIPEGLPDDRRGVYAFAKLGAPARCGLEAHG